MVFNEEGEEERRKNLKELHMKDKKDQERRRQEEELQYEAGEIEVEEKEEEYEEEHEKLKISVKPEIKLKDRILSLYMGNRIVNKMPKFMKEDYFEKKCKEILKFDQSDVEKRVSKFWDPHPLLSLRRCYNKYTE